MTDLIAELAEVAGELSRAFSAENEDSNGADHLWASTRAAGFIARNHATLTRIIESEATLSADYESLVIRLGEVTTKLEAAKMDAARYRWMRELQACPFAETDSAWDGLDALDAAIDRDMEAMRDGAREGGE